ncbi:hypothetical protein PHIN5_11480 [Polynucleobacter sp. HIN5]|nr:hypothetical protein PHIN5_11480 [Polynucleobacter sp. HIN5]
MSQYAIDGKLFASRQARCMIYEYSQMLIAFVSIKYDELNVIKFIFFTIYKILSPITSKKSFEEAVNVHHKKRFC